ncbi:MAG TPA: DNA-binding response regulator [Desulfosporosinus sp.]|nr:DNA-binding response regulator [Desulfosporosinus sp.]
MSSQVISVLLVDDHEMVRVGLATILNRSPQFEVVGEASMCEEAIEKAFQLIPDVIVMDIRMPGRSGIEACRDILAQHPEIKVLMLTSYADEEAVVASIISGAKGYVLKKIGSRALMAAIVKVMQGESLIDQDLLVKVMNRLQKEKDSPEEKLSEREKQILLLIGQGKTNKEIAKTIFLSEKTVRNYVSSILHKLNLAHRSQAAVYAVRNQGDPRSFLGS